MDVKAFLTEMKKKLTELRSLTHVSSVSQLISTFDNAYYTLALDGHEADEAGRKIIDSVPNSVEFFRYIQKEIIDRIYIPSDPSIMQKFPGRLSAPEGLEMFQKYFSKDLSEKIEMELDRALEVCS